LQIIAGQFYRSRNGKKYGPAVPQVNNEKYPWVLKNAHGNSDAFTDDGFFFAHRKASEHDLVTIWTEEPDPNQYKLPDEYGLAHWQKAYANFRKNSAPWEQ
jgi:hypothetical protein